VDGGSEGAVAETSQASTADAPPPPAAGDDHADDGGDGGDTPEAAAEAGGALAPDDAPTPPSSAVPATPADATPDEADEDGEEADEDGEAAAAPPAPTAAPAPAPVHAYDDNPSISMTFRNTAPFAVKIYWLRPKGAQLVSPGTLLAPRACATVKTYTGHMWLVYKAGKDDLLAAETAAAGGEPVTELSAHLIEHSVTVLGDNAQLTAFQHWKLQRHLKEHQIKLDPGCTEPAPEPVGPPESKSLPLEAPPLTSPDKMRAVRIVSNFGRGQECDIVTGACFSRDDATIVRDPLLLTWPTDMRTDQLKRLDIEPLRRMCELLNIGSYDFTAHLITPPGKVSMVGLITSKLEQIKGLSMPKLRAAAMNAGVDAEDLALGVEFERTLSANSKLLKQSSKFEVDEHDEAPADPEDREEIIDKIVRSIKAKTRCYACPPFVQVLLNGHHGPIMYPQLDVLPNPATAAAAQVQDLSQSPVQQPNLSASACDSAAATTGGGGGGGAEVLSGGAPDAPSDVVPPDPARPPPGEFMLAQLAPDMIRAVCTHLALTIQGGPQLTRLQATCRGMRDALAADEPEIHELWELAARSRFVEEIDELLPADTEKLEDVETVTILRAEARTAQAFDTGLSSSVKRELWSPVPLPSKPGRPSSGGVPPVLRPEDVGFAAYKRLHELRKQFKETVTVVRGSISDLPFRVDAIVLPSDDRSMLDVGFGACGAIYRAANGPGGEKLLDAYMRKTYPKECGLEEHYFASDGNPVGTVLPSPSFAMSDRCTTLLHAVGPTWPVSAMDTLGRTLRWCRLGGGEELDYTRASQTWGWYRDVDGTLTGAGDGLGYGTAAEAELTMEGKHVEYSALVKYHATMVRRQTARDLCIVYENIFDLAAEHNCKSVALPGISTGSRGCPNLTAAAVAMDVIQQRIAAGTCPDKVYFVAFDDSSNIYGAFSDVRQEILRRYELLIRPVTAEQPLVWRGGGWRGLSERFDNDQASALVQHSSYCKELEDQLEAMDVPQLEAEEGRSLMMRVTNARRQLMMQEREQTQADLDDEARRQFDIDHGLAAAPGAAGGAAAGTSIPEGIPGASASAGASGGGGGGGSCWDEPEPEPDSSGSSGGGNGNILDAITEEYTLMPLRRSITIHSVDLAKEASVAKKVRNAAAHLPPPPAPRAPFFWFLLNHFAMKIDG
jgi:O-acetyl-ADP-ribose deacetylase (regulator of RNase III)